MSKIELDNIASGYNLGKINANFVKIEEALDNKVLFRDNTATPTEPNQMEQAIDMNGNSLLNLPTPTAPTNPVRLQDIDVTTGDITALDGRVTILEEGAAGDSRYIHWLYNSGSATGGETTINIPYTFTSIATVFINGVRMTYGLAFNYDVTAKTVTLAEALEAADEVVVSIGTEPQIAPLRNPIYSRATLPTLTTTDAGLEAYLIDSTDKYPIHFNGANWLKVSDNTAA